MGGRGEGKERKGEINGREGGNKGSNGDGEEGKGRVEESIRALLLRKVKGGGRK